MTDRRWCYGSPGWVTDNLTPPLEHGSSGPLPGRPASASHRGCGPSALAIPASIPIEAGDVGSRQSDAATGHDRVAVDVMHATVCRLPRYEVGSCNDRSRSETLGSGGTGLHAASPPDRATCGRSFTRSNVDPVRAPSSSRQTWVVEKSRWPRLVLQATIPAFPTCSSTEILHLPHQVIVESEVHFF